MALKTMSIDKLRDMQSKIEAALSRKVTERRRELESELLKLAGFAGGVLSHGAGCTYQRGSSAVGKDGVPDLPVPVA